MKRKFTSALITTAALFLVGGLAHAAAPATLRILVVQPSNLQAYVHELGIVQGILKKAGAPGTVRVWQAQFAGVDAGTVVVSIEFANLAALARYYELAKSNAEFAAELAKLAPMRKVVSDSLYQELGP
jgi:hypothetical protein